MKIRGAYIIFIISITLGISCSSTKYVSQEDYLYTGAQVKVKTDSSRSKTERTLETELTSILRPKPNKRFLGMPFKLWIYDFWHKPGKEKGIRHWISSKFGAPPVLYSAVNTDFQKRLLTNRLENRGYFQSQIEQRIHQTLRKTNLDYDVYPGRPYLIDSIAFPQDSSELAHKIREMKASSFLKYGEPFDLDIIRAERERISARLKEQGYYFFNADQLLILADTSNKPFEVDYQLIIKNDVHSLAGHQFAIRDIYIFPDHQLFKDSVQTEDFTRYQNLSIIDPEQRYKPSIFEQALAFDSSNLYSRTAHNKSLSRLIDLQTFKYVDNRFEVVNDSLLDVYYYLTPFEKRSVRFEITGRSTSTNFAGGEVNVNWQNRNLFRGAENLNLSIYAGTDVQIAGINKGNNIYRLGTNADLVIPRFVSPFEVTTPSAFTPKTHIILGYDYLRRVNSYVLNSFRASFGYKWKEDIKKEHQLTLYAINYIQPSNISEAYQESLLIDPSLANAIQRQFIIGPRYNYKFTNTMESKRKHTFYYNGNLDLSGNIVGLLSGANINRGEERTIFDAPYSQYIRVENDFRYYNDLGRGASLVTRLVAGFGYAYGNSRALPFVKQFFIGGTTSLRAFRPRSLGPGTFQGSNIGKEGVIAADQTADIILEGNIEYRYSFSNIVKGALFLDAGNIWMYREDDNRPGSKFESDFLKELAMGTGIGLRLDFTFFILRGDFSFPIRKPWLEEGSRWVFNEIDFGDSAWRRDNIIFNLAIGYPF